MYINSFETISYRIVSNFNTSCIIDINTLRRRFICVCSFCCSNAINNNIFCNDSSYIRPGFSCRMSINSASIIFYKTKCIYIIIFNNNIISVETNTNKSCAINFIIFNNIIITAYKNSLIWITITETHTSYNAGVFN